MRWAALLRAVNVGGTGKLPMAELRALAEGLSFTNVRTLLASGNLAFDTPETDAAILEARLEAALAAHGVATDVLLRDAAQLDAEIAANPFPDAVERPSRLLLTFLREPLPPATFASLKDAHTGPERLHAAGRVLYVDYLDADTMRDSKLAQAMRRAKFPPIATGRNWNTVAKLRAELG